MYPLRRSTTSTGTSSTPLQPRMASALSSKVCALAVRGVECSSALTLSLPRNCGQFSQLGKVDRLRSQSTQSASSSLSKQTTHPKLRWLTCLLEPQPEHCHGCLSRLGRMPAFTLWLVVHRTKDEDAP